MNPLSLGFLKLCLFATISMAAPLLAQELPDRSADEAAIRTIGAEYIEAFNKRDAAAVAGFWSPEAVYVNRLTGEQVVGQASIQELFQELFASDIKLQLAISVDSIEFVSPNVAVEHGVAAFAAEESTPDEIAYTAIYVRRNGKWLLDRVTDKEALVRNASYERLKALEWIIGEWVDEDDETSIVTECKWSKNNSFIVRSFAVSIEGQIDLSGMQIVGWDGAAEQVRSWTFDSDGGFSEGRWTQKGDQWFVSKIGVLADGRKATAVNVITKVDDNSFKLQSTQRMVAGELLPNIDEVLVVRK